MALLNWSAAVALYIAPLAGFVLLIWFPPRRLWQAWIHGLFIAGMALPISFFFTLMVLSWIFARIEILRGLMGHEGPGGAVHLITYLIIVGEAEIIFIFRRRNRLRQS
jgi:hypothetical protein